VYDGIAWRTTYVYKIKAKNNGLKTIKALYWEYQFIAPATQTILVAHRMVSFKKLSPGKTAVFKAETSKPPVDSVSAKQLERCGDQLSERVIILRVDYTDGSFWERQ
jgi:hypothetical protein